MANELGVVIVMPRISKETSTSAVASSVIDYSKLSICIPLMDEILVDLNKNI